MDDRPQTVPGDLVSPAAAAGEYAVSVTTIYRWRRAGRLRSYRRGQRVLVSRSDVRELVTPTPEVTR